jgi:uncharacterized membrane protein required for colicin V production
VILDLILVVALVGIAVRGWTRGVLREAVDVAGLAIGIVLAFRVAPPLGTVVAAMSGMSEEASRLTAGVVVLGVVIAGIVMMGRSLDRRMAAAELGGLDRAAGAGLATTWGVFLITVLVTLASLGPLPPSVDERIESSAIARSLADPDGVPQRVFERLAGDRIVATLLTLQRVFGDRRVIIGPDDTIEIPAAAPGDLRPDVEAAAEVYSLVNRARVDEGLAPLAWSDPLAEVALGHAYDMYLGGFFSHTSPTTGGLADRLRVAAIPYRMAGENLALAATPAEVHRGLMESPGHRANIMAVEYRRVGIAVVSGRLGLMTVQVFTG